jgi:hypothetical protein
MGQPGAKRKRRKVFRRPGRLTRALQAALLLV